MPHLPPFVRGPCSPFPISVDTDVNGVIVREVTFASEYPCLKKAWMGRAVVGYVGRRTWIRILPHVLIGRFPDDEVHDCDLAGFELVCSA